MFSGLTRHEQWVLLGLIALIGAALVAHEARSRNRPEMILLTEDPAPAAQLSAVSTAAIAQPAAPALPAPAQTPGPLPALVDLNLATAADLERLPGIGEKKAADILADRQANGPFRGVDDLDRVKGFGPATVENLRPYITVGAPPGAPAPSAPPPTALANPTPAPADRVAGYPQSLRININTAGKEELMRLNGIGDRLAERILEYRARYGPFRRPEDLMNVQGIGEKTLEQNRRLITVE